MIATPGRIEDAAYALWRQDAAKSPHLDPDELWPRVRRAYLKKAHVALLAADQAPAELTAEQLARAGLTGPPNDRDGERALELDLDGPGYPEPVCKCRGYGADPTDEGLRCVNAGPDGCKLENDKPSA